MYNFICKLLFKVLLFFVLVNVVIAYVIDENGREIQVTDKKAVAAVDDIEIQDNEALTNHQIVEVVDYVEAKDKGQKTNINISDD